MCIRDRCRNAMTLRALENKFERYDMVICDEFGYVSCDKAGAEIDVYKRQNNNWYNTDF